MTLDEFKQELVKLGYKLQRNISNSDLHTAYKKRNRDLVIQHWKYLISGEEYNIFYHIYRRQYTMSYEFNQHRVTDFKKALQNILKFERKIK